MKPTISNNPYTLKYIVEYLINQYITFDIIILTIMVIFGLIFVSHIRLKTLIFITIGFLFFAFSFLLIYDITYINFMLSLHLENTVRVFLSTRFSSFYLGNHAPSKAMPRIELSLFNILHVKWHQFFIVKEAYKYVKLVQKRLLFLSRIYILILTLPDQTYHLKQGMVVKINHDLLKSNISKNKFKGRGNIAYA